MLGKLVAAPLWEPSLERLLVEERGNGDSREDPDDEHDGQDLDQGESLLGLVHPPAELGEHESVNRSSAARL
jgi:hypothetical protein